MRAHLWSVGLAAVLAGCGGAVGPSADGTSGSGSSAGSTSGGGGSGTSSGGGTGCASGMPTGSWTVTQITCGGSTSAFLTAEYSGSNRIVYTFAGTSSLGQGTVIGGCTMNVSLDLTVTGSDSFSVVGNGRPITCTPAGCSTPCGTSPASTTVHYTYCVTGGTLTLTSNDSGICSGFGGQPTVITATP